MCFYPRIPQMFRAIAPRANGVKALPGLRSLNCGALATRNCFSQSLRMQLLPTLIFTSHKIHTASTQHVDSRDQSQNAKLILDSMVDMDMRDIGKTMDEEVLAWATHPDFEDPQQFAKHYKEALIECGADEMVAKVYVFY